MIILKAICVLMLNFIMYMAFGSFFAVRKNIKWSATLTITVGFFAYYALFAVITLPVMFTYRPLSLLGKIWMVLCISVLVCSVVLFGKPWAAKIAEIIKDIWDNRYFWLGVCTVTVLAMVAVAITYSFTLDAAYYVANVTTNVDTNMINVYDPFTGNWQDHFELRYVFATYSVNDSVICQITKLPALVQTKVVMSSTVMIMVNSLYVMISRYFHRDLRRAFLMYILTMIVNCMFISIYTASNFLMTRTYEGKSIVGNISLIIIFVLYLLLVSDSHPKGLFIMLFVICMGTATISSTANMVIPTEVVALFAPYAFMKKKPQILVKALICILPEILMMLVYVMYVKGYYAIYTYPR